MCPKPSFANQYYRDSTGRLFRIICLLDQMHGDDAVNDTKHLSRDHRATGEEIAQLKWKAEHPLAHRLMWEYFIYEQGRTLGHASRAATGAETATLATESDQEFLVAVLAPYPQKFVIKPATLQVVFEFPLHIARQYPAFLGQLLPEIRVVL